MLKRLGPSVIEAGETTSTALFPSTLEFNPPAHGTWNIVHIGMLVPEAHQIYVCAVNCMRGVVLTAAEMGMQNRFSCVVLKEEDIIRGTVEAVTLEGISDVLRKLPTLPPCVMVFPVCTHLFLGVPMGRVYRELERRFPEVDFVRAYMDPISRKRLIPDVRLRKAMYDPLQPCVADEKRVCLMGSDFAPDDDSDLRTLLAAGNRQLTCVQDCATYDEFLSLAKAGTILAMYPNGRYGAERCAKRLGRRYLWLPMSLCCDEIEQEERLLCDELDLPLPNFADEVQACEDELTKTHAVVGGTPIALDATAHPRPLGLARLLLEHGMNVTEVYLDGVLDEDAPALEWLRSNAPHVELSSAVMPELRVAPRRRAAQTLAIGQRAAWFTGTEHFVNLVQGGGLWGYAGIRTMARLMREAWINKKDTRDLVPRKGLGCESCL